MKRGGGWLYDFARVLQDGGAVEEEEEGVEEDEGEEAGGEVAETVKNEWDG
jgi:hypothetical protein